MKNKYLLSLNKYCSVLLRKPTKSIQVIQKKLIAKKPEY